MTAATDVSWMPLAVALGIGLLIGMERERRKGTGASRRSAGIRTFALVSLLGGVSALLGPLLMAAAALGVGALAVAGYQRNRTDDPGLTSEVALLVTYMLGAWAMTQPAWAAGMGVMVAVLLAAREPIHEFVKDWLTAREVTDLLVLAVATLLVLPVMPDHALGPWNALHPRTLWTVVILVMTVAAAGHIALRVVGSRWGLPLVGLFGGFVSSTVTVGAMGARARATPLLLHGAVAGAVLSTLATMIQLTLILVVTSAATLRVLALPLACAGAAALAIGLLMTLKSLHKTEHPPVDQGSAFSLRTALSLAGVMAMVSLASAGLSQHYGQAGLAIAALVAGLADAHSPAVSAATLAASGAITPQQAALPVLLALSSNTLAKCVVVALSGGLAYAAQLIPSLVLVTCAAWAGWWLL